MDQGIVSGRAGRISLAAGRWGLTGVVVFVASTAMMHVVQPELSPVDDAISYYMNGRLGWMLGCGLIALGGGSVALAASLRRIQTTDRGRAGAWLLALWGLGLVVGGIFPPDPIGSWDRPPSVAGLMHNGAAMVAFLSFPAAALLLSYGRVSESAVPRLRLLRILAMLCAGTLLVFFICLAPAFMGRPPYYLGLVERVLIGFFLGWLVMADRLLLRATTRARTSSDGGGFLERREEAIP